MQLRRLAAKVHGLGPGPLFYMFCDLERGKPVHETIEQYAALDGYGDFIAAYGGALAPSPFVIEGGKR